MSTPRKLFPAVLIILVIGLLAVWLALTPPGLLGKMDAIGYAVCHQISERSFFIAGRQLPLCARCSGMYLGALVGLVFFFREGKNGGMPARSILALLFVLAAVFIIDSINSFLTLQNRLLPLYQPANWLRLLTGSGLGLGMAAVLAATFNQTAWQDYSPRPVLQLWNSTAALIGIALVVDLALLSGYPLLVYPLSIFSSLGVMAVLSLAYTLVWIMVTHRENTFTYWKQARWHLLAGFGCALGQIGLIDLLRYASTGSWAGF